MVFNISSIMLAIASKEEHVDHLARLYKRKQSPVFQLLEREREREIDDFTVVRCRQKWKRSDHAGLPLNMEQIHVKFQ